MKRKTDPYGHVRSIFAPDEPTAQTSLFADLRPESRPIHLYVDPAGLSPFRVKAEDEARQRFADENDQAIEDMAEAMRRSDSTYLDRRAELIASIGEDIFDEAVLTEYRARKWSAPRNAWELNELFGAIEREITDRWQPENNFSE